MKSGLRGGKPRDMATFKKGGVSRGAGAAKKGFDYAIYKKGGKVKKYQEGGALPERDPQTGTRQYASFSDWMGDLFGKKKEAPKADTSKPRDLRPASSYEDSDDARRREGSAGGPAGPRALAERAPRPSEYYDRTVSNAPPPPPPAPRPARPLQSAAQRRIAARRRQDQETMARDVAESGMRNDPRAQLRTALENEADARLQQAQGVGDDPILAAAAAARRRQIASGLYAKGGKVKMAGGGSCRGMGAAQRGGKYTIK